MPTLLRTLPYVLTSLVVGTAATALLLRPVQVAGARAEEGAIIDEVLGVGVLESAWEVDVSFEAAGRVTGLSEEAGATVTRGAMLGTLDVSDATRELGVAESAQGAAGAAVSRAQAEVDRARAGLAQATADRKRSDLLAAGGAMNAADHESATRREASALAEARALDSALHQAEQTRSGAARTLGIRAAHVADGKLYSPLSGLIVTRHVEVGQHVTPGAPAFTLIATDAMRVRAWVDETALGRLAIGQPARIVFRSEGARSFPGTVESIGRAVDRQTHELLVDVAITELPTNFAIGQRADAWIELGRRDGVVRIPTGLCTTECAVAEDGRVAVRSVTLGLSGRDAVEVVSGLLPGDMVLAPGAQVGSRVRVLEAK